MKFELGSDEVIQFRFEIGLLHERLDSFELLSGKAMTKRIPLGESFCGRTHRCEDDDQCGILLGSN
jgi:hypothetical protein